MIYEIFGYFEEDEPPAPKSRRESPPVGRYGRNGRVDPDACEGGEVDLKEGLAFSERIRD